MEQWKTATPNHHTWKVKYYKGLGTSTSKEAKEYFSDMAKHRIPFKYIGSEDDRAIELVSILIHCIELLTFEFYLFCVADIIFSICFNC